MKKISLVAGLLSAVCVSVSVPAPAEARNRRQPEMAVTPPRPIENPYGPALRCLASQLTPEQRATSIGVAYMAERTGRESYASESSAGKFLSQGSEDILMNDLAETGMTVVAIDPVYRMLVDWVSPRLAANPQNQLHFNLPDVVVQGSFSSLDFGSSDANEVYILGIGGGHRTYTIRYTLDARAMSMPGGRLAGNPLVGGQMLTHLSLVKDVVGRERRAGAVGFFGLFGSSTYVEVNLDRNRRELLQYSQRYMISRMAYGIVADLWDITACEPQLQYGDALISGGQTPQTLAQN